MLEIKTNVSDKKAEIKLIDSATIQNVSELKNAISDLCENINYLDLDINSINNLDISFLQILISLKKSMDTKGKALNFKGLDNSNFHKTISDCGCPKYEWFFKELKHNTEELKNE